ncbi:hypothetical protein DUI87_15481 [Hirundo rustica rustica]|uniref:TOG domain-containing protein n=1 Tax=Hirundo rustica rustica TaxID=333673 RepID=A0A3M0K400_HIRRU|nr:hypothetical protein DUI87_15481 [Hirundo rustica rustica]
MDDHRVQGIFQHAYNFCQHIQRLLLHSLVAVSNSQDKSLTGYPLAKRFSLASPSVLLPSKPLPPIRPSSPSSKPSKICSGEKEHGKNGSGYEDGSRKKQLISEGKECKASLLYCRGGDMKKGSLGPPLIPPIRKAVSPHVGSAAGSLQSPPQLDFQDSRDMRPRSSSRCKEKDSEHAGLTGYPLAKRFSLASPSVLLPSKPLPPIRPSSPSSKQSKICSGEKEHGENGSGYGEDSRNSQDLISEGRGCKASLLYCRGGDMKKGSLGPPLIPPIGKAVSPHVGSAAGSLQSPPQLDFQDSRDMRPRSSSRCKEKDSEHAASSGSTTNTQRKKGKSSWCRIGPGMPLFPRKLADLFGLKTYEQNPVLGNGGLGSRPAEGPLAQEPRQRQLSSAVPRVDAEEDKVKAEHGSASPRGLPWSQAKEMGHSTSPGPTRYEELRDGFEKLHAVLYWLARENLDQKDVERWVEEIKERRQKNMFLQLPPQTADPGDAAEASFSLPPVNGTASGVQRKHPRSALKKKVLRKEDNVPLHSKTPIIHGDGSFPRKLPSVTSQTATGAERPEEPLRGHGQKGTASSDPQQSLLQALSLLSSDDWELKEKGLLSIKHLAGSHSEVLLCRLHDVCWAVSSEVTNLRSKVSYSAIVALGELFAAFKKDMDSEVDEVSRVLLQVVWNSPEFVQEAATQTLGIMVANVTPARAMTALMDRGVKSRQAQVRKCAAKLLLSLMEKIGVTELADTPRAERLAHVAGKLAQDCDKDTRHYGQEMVKMFLSHQKLKWLFEQSVSTRDLEDIMTRIRKKGMENQEGEKPSVKKLEKRNDDSKKPQATLPLSKRVNSASDGRLLQRAKSQVTLPPAVEETELLQKLYHLLEAKGFQTRVEGVTLLLDLCKSSPQLISTNIVQIFDYFVRRIADSHKKVKQKALDVLAEIIGVLEDALNPVIIGLVEGITKNLNSKDRRVHAAAVKALEESIAHLDKVELMKEFSYQWSKLSGQALLEIMERITVLVEWVYPRSPEVVQHYALPVLWSSLGNKALPVRSANVRTVVTKLASALYEVMGTKLKKHAASQPPHVQENLSSILGW